MDLLICATCESVTEKYGLRKIYEANDFHQSRKIFSKIPGFFHAYLLHKPNQ